MKYGFGMISLAWLMASLAFVPAAMADVMIPVDGDPITIDTGKVSGTQIEPSVKAYLGIPFAAPPVRENRWRAPQPVEAWDGIYNADGMKPECPQGQRSPGINHYFGEESVSEDCLYLNVWAPSGAKAGDKLPVVVWIYGGAFNVGSASSPIYSGEPMAEKGVIYVAANYRLGVLGFMAHPELTAESGHGASGNWGFLDQVAALKWVQRNIASFGGDPANVTLLGQSAGSMSINNLQASPLAKGLFAKVFGMSGATVAGGPGDAAGTPLADAEKSGVALQEAMKAQSVAEMRTVSWDKVMATAQQARVRIGPSVDGYYLPKSVQSIFAAGEQSDVPVVTGHTANDIGTNNPVRTAKTLAEYRSLAQQAYGDKAGELLRLWPATTDAAAVAAADNIGTNSGFGVGAWNWARLQDATGDAPSYLFLVSRVQPFTPGVVFSDFDQSTAGAYHMGDVPYFLGTYEAFNLFRPTRDWTDLDRTLSDEMQNVIVSFAKTGNPSTAAARFVPFDPNNPRRTVFGDTIHLETLNPAAMQFLLENSAAPLPPPDPSAPRQTF